MWCGATNYYLRNAFKEGALSASSDDIEMTVIDNVPEKVFVVQDIDEANTVVETEDVAEDVVIKAEVPDDDFLGNALTEEDFEPFVVQTVVKSFSNDYLSSLLKGNVKLSEFNHEMKNKIILVLCTNLAVNKTF